MNDLAGALKDYTKAISTDSNDPALYYNRGNVRLQMHDPHGALQDYNIAIQLNPEFAEAYMGRGNAKLELGSQAGAEIDFTRAEKILKRRNSIPPLTNPIVG
jgi:tetratricopeptide (TPR) repeat protein